MKKNITIMDVSKESGVSKSTISNFLNGKYDKMSKETKNIIEQTIKNMGYVPNLSARRLPNKEKSKTICLIIPNNLTRIFDSMYHPVAFSAIERISIKSKYNIIICSRNKEDQNQIQYFKGMASSTVDGFLIFDLASDDIFFKEFDLANIPYVCVGKVANYDDYDYVASDHKGAMETVLDYLLDTGHKKIGVWEQYDFGVVKDAREIAAENICKKHNVSLDNIKYINTDLKSTNKEIYDVWEKILSDKNRPTAYVLTSVILQHFLLVVSDLGLKVPEDISYVNMEYYPKDKDKCDEQTRVESKTGYVAELAFKKLLRKIYTNSSNFESVMVPLEFIQGNTTSKRE